MAMAMAVTFALTVTNLGNDNGSSIVNGNNNGNDNNIVMLMKKHWQQLTIFRPFCGVPEVAQGPEEDKRNQICDLFALRKPSNH